MFFSLHTPVAKALKVVIMIPLLKIYPIFLIFQNLIFQIIPSNPLSQIFNFYGNINLEKKDDLTPNTPLIHTSFTYRKFNMDEICGLKSHSL